MQVLEILHPGRVAVAGGDGARIRNKTDAIRRLAELLAAGDARLAAGAVEDVLTRREAVQSTGVGGGVAIPHASVEEVDQLVGALLLCPDPIGFDAIDGMPVSILFAIIGPRKSTGEHLKALAKISRLLRDDGFRSRLVGAESGAEAFDILRAAEEGG